LENILKESITGSEMNLLLTEFKNCNEIMLRGVVFKPEDLIEKWHVSVDKQRYLIANKLSFLTGQAVEFDG
jgi:hypothetical protein